MIPVDHWRDSYVRKSLQEMSQKAGANLVIGLDRFSVDKQGLKHFNSAAFVTPDRGVVDHLRQAASRDLWRVHPAQRNISGG